MRVLPIAGFVLALGAAAAGCSATPAAGQRVTLDGTLVLRGSMPLATPVLVRSPTEHWELQRVAPAKAMELQNRKVKAVGVVVRTAAQGPLLPALQVLEIQAVQ